MTVPIINYGSEIWGFDEWPTLERLHLSACKYILGVKSSTCTEAIYAELGRISIQCSRHINILKFLFRLESLLDLEPDRYVCKSFEAVSNGTNNGSPNWVSKARKLKTRYEISHNDTTAAIKSKVRSHFTCEIMNKLKMHVVLNKKLCTYAQVKTVFKFESYLDIVKDFNKRRCLSRLRLSAHNLEVETGRFGKKPYS